MYQAENSGDLLKNKRKLLTSRLAWLTVSQTVLGLGFTSFFTDISSEMVSTTLPIYLITVLRLAPLELGILDGLYQGAAILVKLASGLFADRFGRHKDVAVVGYGLSAFSKLGLLLAGGSWGGLMGITIMDRIGKGIRTSPRDAMIAASTPNEKLGTAFGVHRMLDTAGAMVGPLVASALLWFTRSAYDSVFVVSLCFALVGLAVLVTFVRPARAATSPTSTEVPTTKPRAITLADATRLLAEPRFRGLVIAAGLLSLVTISDSLLHLNMQRKLSLSPGVFPLIYVFVALVYMLLAIPFGRLADQLGRRRLLIAGYVPLGLAYGLVLLPFTLATSAASIGVLVVYVVLLGCYYAATDGVLIALASSLLPEQTRTSGLALLTSVTGLARLLASVAFGAVWSGQGASSAIVIFLVGLVAVGILSSMIWLRGER